MALWGEEGDSLLTLGEEQILSEVPDSAFKATTRIVWIWLAEGFNLKLVVAVLQLTQNVSVIPPIRVAFGPIGTTVPRDDVLWALDPASTVLCVPPHSQGQIPIW